MLYAWRMTGVNETEKINNVNHDLAIYYSYLDQVQEIHTDTRWALSEPKMLTFSFVVNMFQKCDVVMRDQRHSIVSWQETNW